jgi:hypothetical protein
VSTSRVDFTRGAAERIAAVVRQVEGGNRDGAPLTFGKVDTPGGKVFRMCTFTGTWAIDTPKTLTFRGVTATPNTVVAYNLFAVITTAGTATSTPCAIAKEGTAWYLIAARCS